MTLATIGWVDLQAWAFLTGNLPAPWEVDALMRLDIAFAAANAPPTKPG